MTPVRAAVVGCGAFGRNHLRVTSSHGRTKLQYAVDVDPEKAAAAGKEFQAEALSDYRELAGKVDAAVVATPTTTHVEVAECLLESGIDVLIEKPITPDLASARRLDEIAKANGRVLAVGHLERFNPAVIGLKKVVSVPLFFEIHRMSMFAPRSLDVDVVLDLMIHDVDIVLSLVNAMPEEVRAAGIRIMSQKVDIANVRLAFPGGCVANLTASRVSTEKVRKLRLFQPHQYISLDYSKQSGVGIKVSGTGSFSMATIGAEKAEPLVAQWDAFVDAVEQRTAPAVGATEATRALEVCLDILDKIEVHAGIVNETLASHGLV